MDVRRSLCFLLWTIVAIRAVHCRTITHHKTTTSVNGDKVTKSWTSVEDDDSQSGTDADANTNAGDDPLGPPGSLSAVSRQFENMIATDLSGLPTTELLKQAVLANGMDPIAVNELLKTKKPVITSTTDGAGVKRTTTYKLNADGSISSSTDIEAEPLVLKESHAALRNIYHRQNEPDAESIVGRVPLRSTPTLFNGRIYDAANWHSIEDDKDLFGRRYLPGGGAPPLLPESWNPDKWAAAPMPFPAPVSQPRRAEQPATTQATPTWPERALFKPIEGLDQPGAVRKTFKDDKGRTVTTTYSAGPTHWTRRTYTHPTTKWFTLDSATKQTDLDDFFKSAFETTPASPTPTTTATTIKLEDVPIMGVLKDGKPLEDSAWGTLPPHLRPIDAAKDITTFRTENIPMSPGIETTKVKTYSTQVHSDALPTSADLQPGAREILRNAGISPEDIKSADGDTITKTRTEPDGKIITTTYRVSKIPSTSYGFTNPHYDFPTQQNPFDADRMEGLDLYPAFPQLPSGVFPTYNAGPAFPKSPAVQAVDETTTTTPRTEPHNLIVEFLTQLQLTPADLLATNGEWFKTILDQDGRVLTAHLVLSTTKDASSNQVVADPIK